MLMGNLTRDPELKYTPKGTAIAQIGLAVTRTYTLPESGEKREETTFVDVEAFGKQAETIGEYCKKGKALYLEGRLKLDTWDDKQSGQKRSKLKVMLESFQFLGGREGGGASEHADNKATPPPAQRRTPTQAPRPPADPDLDAQPDDIPF